MGLCGGTAEKKPARKHDRRYPELEIPGKKVQIDVKEVPYCCLKGAAKRDESTFTSGQLSTNVPECGLSMALRNTPQKTL